MDIKNMRTFLVGVFLSTTTLTLAPQSANAFCGFYVAGGESSLFNDATQVVLMRKGQRTVLSMQNNYQGPPENFAMVIPVPVVLQQDNVKTLAPELFGKIDNLSAPRLVEYWEQDPCIPDYYDDEFGAVADGATNAEDGGVDDDEGSVTVEAEFAVGEYDIVVLSTDDASALEQWLTTNDYTIPEGANVHFDPYVQSGSYFFVAKVRVDEVTFNGENAVLSPLRFYYDTPTFSLPIKLGLINAQGSQDLIVYTLGEEQRYEVANRPNVTIPTNIEVINDVRDDFGTFYRTLFAETIAQNPGAAVTEYSWASSSCDPCPGPPLDQNDIATLGGDVVSSGEVNWRNWTLPRIHLRYDASTLGDDLVFAEAEPIFGGREVYSEARERETGSGPGWTNNFQGRYIIRHRWDGPVECDSPVYGRWGGPDGADFPGAPQSATSPNTEGAASSDSATTGGGGLPSDDLEDLGYDNIPELDVVASNDPPASTAPSSGCNCESADGSAFFLLLGGLYFLSRRRRRALVK